MENVKALQGMCQPNTENCPRFKADEKKTFVTNSEMLEQILRNSLPLMEDVCYWCVADNLSAQTISERITETIALLARKD